MVARGEGYFMVTASAAGLLNIVETAPYGVTKHAAGAFAEWLRIAYGRRGLGVSWLCPQSGQTGRETGDGWAAHIAGAIGVSTVAAEVVATMQSEKFLVLPHPQVLQYFQAKAVDYDRWLCGMHKLHAMHAA